VVYMPDPSPHFAEFDGNKIGCRECLLYDKGCRDRRNRRPADAATVEINRTLALVQLHHMASQETEEPTICSVTNSDAHRVLAEHYLDDHLEEHFRKWTDIVVSQLAVSRMSWDCSSVVYMPDLFPHLESVLYSASANGRLRRLFLRRQLLRMCVIRISTLRFLRTRQVAIL
jgi:hypothetical protein